MKHFTRIIISIFSISLTISIFSLNPVKGYGGTPYGGTPWTIPGIIEFENYDDGGSGISYFDTTTNNQGGLYRTDGVDIVELPGEGAGGRYSISWLETGEWLKYTVNIIQTGSYQLRIRGNLPDYQQNTPTSFSIKLNDQFINGGEAASTFTNYYGHFGWRGFSTIPQAQDSPIIVSLPAGIHVIEVRITSGGGGGLNYMLFEPTNINPNPEINYPPANSQSYYVSPSGNDNNPGTINQPWRTLTKASNFAYAGSTIYLRGGTYTDRLIPQHSGTKDNFIIFKAYPQETPIIDGSSISFPQAQGLVHIANQSFIQISGLKIINTQGYWNMGIMLDYADSIIIDNNHIENTYSSGISTSRGSRNILIDSNTLTRNNQGSDDTEVALGTYWFSYNIDVQNNTIHSGKGEGIGVAAGPHHVRIHNNTVYSMGTHRPGIGIYIDSWTEYQDNIQVYNNIVRHNSTDGISVSNEGGGLLNKVKIYNNLVYNTASYGQIGITNWSNTSVTSATTHPLKNIWVYNNTIAKTSGSGGNGSIFINNPEVENLVIKNNILNTGTCSYDSLNIYTNGVCLQNFRSSLCSGSACDQYRIQIAQHLTSSHNLIESNAGFVNQNEANFRLISTSPAINSATLVIDEDFNLFAPGFDFDGMSRPFGMYYDIGAFEFGSTTTPTPSSPIPHPADPNADGVVNIFDLNHVIANFTSLTLSAYQTVIQYFGKIL